MIFLGGVALLFSDPKAAHVAPLPGLSFLQKVLCGGCFNLLDPSGGHIYIDTTGVARAVCGTVRRAIPKCRTNTASKHFLAMGLLSKVAFENRETKPHPP